MDMKHILNVLIVFMLWTFFSCCCHWCSKKILTLTHTEGLIPSVWMALLLTITQVLVSWTLMDVGLSSTGAPVSHFRLGFILTTHCLAVLTTNISLSFMAASSTITVKLLEPVMTAFLADFIMKTSHITNITYISLIMLCTGAILFVGHPLHSSNITTGIVLAIMSNLLYGLRNIAVKHSNSRIVGTLFDWKYYMLLTSLLSLPLYRFMNVSLMYLLGSSISHFIYSYISLFVVLNYMSAINHAIANIGKRVSVVLGLLLLGNEEFTLKRFTGLAICAVALMIYIQPKQINQKGQEDTQNKARHKRRNILLISLTILCFTSAVYSVHQHSFERYRNETQNVPLYPKRSEWKTDTMRLLKWSIGSDKNVILLNVQPVDTFGEAMLTYGLITALKSDRNKVITLCVANKPCKALDTIYKSDTVVIIRLILGQRSRGSLDLYKNIISKLSYLRLVFILRSYWDFKQEDFKLLTDQITTDMDVYFLTCSNLLGDKLIAKIPLTAGAINELAFSIDTQARFMKPIYDIVWLTSNRSAQPCNLMVGNSTLRCDARDWMTQSDWRHHISDNPIENSYTKTYIAMCFIQRGRIVVIERLDALITAIISDIPAIIVGGIDSEMDSFWSLWKHRLGVGVYYVNSRQKAASLAETLLFEMPLEYTSSLANFIKPIKHALKVQAHQKDCFGKNNR